MKKKDLQEEEENQNPATEEPKTDPKTEEATGETPEESAQNSEESPVDEKSGEDNGDETSTEEEEGGDGGEEEVEEEAGDDTQTSEEEKKIEEELKGYGLEFDDSMLTKNNLLVALKKVADLGVELKQANAKVANLEKQLSETPVKKSLMVNAHKRFETENGQVNTQGEEGKADQGQGIKQWLFQAAGL